MDADAASFSTDMEAISLGSTSLIAASNPSITTKGDALFNVPIPRIVRVPPSAPGCPEFWVTCSPATFPANAIEAFVIGRLSISAIETDVTAPVRFTFFCFPNPTTTTSCSPKLSSSSFIISSPTPGSTLTTVCL
ncbi:hypothetical protein D3C80_702150 [compost metagenome]